MRSNNSSLFYDVVASGGIWTYDIQIHVPNESARSAITTIQAAIKEYTAQLQISDKDQNQKIGLTLEEFSWVNFAFSWNWSTRSSSFDRLDLDISLLALNPLNRKTENL